MKKKIKENFFIIFLIVLIAALGLSLLLGDPLYQLRDFFVDKYFILSAVIYFIAVIISTILFSITILPVIPFVSKVFGSLDTFFLTLFGILLGSSISFFLARKLDKSFISKIFSEPMVNGLGKNIPKNLNFYNILFFRLFMPPDGLSYHLGINKKIKFWKYFFATALGLVPITFILSFGADALSGESKFLFFFLIFAILIIIFSKIFFKYLKRDKVKIITHPYNFHLDDLFSVASIALFMEKKGLPYEIIRTNEEDKLSRYKTEAKIVGNKDKVFLVDIGSEYNPNFNFFDHHQKGGAIIRENGIPYSSFGLVWKKYGEKLCGSKEVAEKIDFDIVLGVDANDTGLNLSKPLYNFFLYGLPSLKNSFFPTSGKKEDYTIAFLKVLEIFKLILENEIKWAEKKLNDEKKFEALYNDSKDKRVIWIDNNLSVGKYFYSFPEILFIVKKKDENWIITAVTENNKNKEVKQKMPQNWCGLRGVELEKVSGIKGAIFCHNGGWIAAVNSRESAKKMIEKLLPDYNF